MKKRLPALRKKKVPCGTFFVILPVVPVKWLPPKTGTVFKGAVMEDGTSSCD